MKETFAFCGNLLLKLKLYVSKESVNCGSLMVFFDTAYGVIYLEEKTKIVANCPKQNHLIWTKSDGIGAHK